MPVSSARRRKQRVLERHRRISKLSSGTIAIALHSAEAARPEPIEDKKPAPSEKPGWFRQKVNSLAASFVILPTAVNSAAAATDSKPEEILSKLPDMSWWDRAWTAWNFYSSYRANLPFASDYGKQAVVELPASFSKEQWEKHKRLVALNILFLVSTGLFSFAQWEINKQGYESGSEKLVGEDYKDATAGILGAVATILTFAGRFIGMRKLSYKFIGLWDLDTIFTKEIVSKLNRAGEKYTKDFNEVIRHAFITIELRKLEKLGLNITEAQWAALIEDNFDTLHVGNIFFPESDESTEPTAGARHRRAKSSGFHRLSVNEDKNLRRIKNAIIRGNRAYDKSEFNDEIAEEALTKIDALVGELTAEINKSLQSEASAAPAQDEQKSKPAQLLDPEEKPIKDQTREDITREQRQLKLDIATAIVSGIASDAIFMEKFFQGFPVSFEGVDNWLKGAIGAFAASPSGFLYANAGLEIRELFADAYKTLQHNPKKLSEFIKMTIYNVSGSSSMGGVARKALLNPTRVLQFLNIDLTARWLMQTLSPGGLLSATVRAGAFVVNIGSYLKTFQGPPGIEGLSIYLRRKTFGSSLSKSKLRINMHNLFQPAFSPTGSEVSGTESMPLLTPDGTPTPGARLPRKKT